MTTLLSCTQVEIPENALSLLILIGKSKEYHFNRFRTKFQEEKNFYESEEEFVERVTRIRREKKNITKVDENAMNNVQLLLEISKNTWENNDYTPEKVYKGELIPDRFIDDPKQIKEYLDNYETQLIQYGWVGTSRCGYFGRLSTDDGSVDRRHIWLNSKVCQYEIDKRRHFSGPILEDWREKAINRQNEYRKDASIYENNMKLKMKEFRDKTINQKTMSTYSGPMRRTRGGTPYSFPIQLLVSTKTNPPLAPRGIINTFPPNS